MVEHAAPFEWREDGEAAEIVVYAPDERSAVLGYERALPAARLPGVVSPVYAAAALSPPAPLPSLDFGSVAVSETHAAPDLASVPVRGLLLVADAGLSELGVPPAEVRDLMERELSGVRLPVLDGAAARELCENGALWAAEAGLIEEEDLALFGVAPDADADALLRRAISAGVRGWGLLPDEVRPRGVGEILDAGGAETLGLAPGAFVLAVSAGAGDLGRLAFTGHRERLSSLARSGEFAAEESLPAAPAGTQELSDLLAAAGAASKFADGRAALLVYALRRALGGVAGALSLRTAWRQGGLESSRDGAHYVHRRDLSAVATGDVAVSGASVVAGTGKMLGSVPPFAAPPVDERPPWEEAELLERWAELHLLQATS